MKGWGGLKETMRMNRNMFLRLESGKPVLIHLLDREPEQFKKHSVEKMYKQCKGIGCEWCAKNVVARKRFAINVWDFETKSVKILEHGPMVFNQLGAYYESYDRKLDDVDFKIIRQGEGLKSQYAVLPMVPSRFNESMLNGHKIFDLTDMYQKDVVEIEDPNETPF